jgi:hypothetical protein
MKVRRRREGGREGGREGERGRDPTSCIRIGTRVELQQRSPIGPNTIRAGNVEKAAICREMRYGVFAECDAIVCRVTRPCALHNVVHDASELATVCTAPGKPKVSRVGVFVAKNMWRPTLGLEGIRCTANSKPSRTTWNTHTSTCETKMETETVRGRVRGSEGQRERGSEGAREGGREGACTSVSTCQCNINGGDHYRWSRLCLKLCKGIEEKETYWQQGSKGWYHSPGSGIVKGIVKGRVRIGLG